LTAAKCAYTDVPGVSTAINAALARLGITALLDAAISVLLRIFGLTAIAKFLYELIKLLLDAY